MENAKKFNLLRF